MLSDDDSSGIDDDQMQRDMLDESEEDLDDEVVTKMTSSMSLEEKEARKAKLVPSLPATEWGLSTQKPQPQPTETEPPSSSPKPFSSTKPSNAAPSSSFDPPPTFIGSQAASALPISTPTLALEELDRQQKLKALLNDQAKSLPPIKMRRPLLPRDEFDGVDSDDESDEDEQLTQAQDGGEGKGKWGETLASALGEEENEEDEEDLPQVVGEVEIDMDEEEEEFLKFAREALGVDEGMWEGILKEREGRGCESSFFVPSFISLHSR